MCKAVRATVVSRGHWKKKKKDLQLLTPCGRVMCIEVFSLSMHFTDSLVFLFACLFDGLFLPTKLSRLL